MCMVAVLRYRQQKAASAAADGDAAETDASQPFVSGPCKFSEYGELLEDGSVRVTAPVSRRSAVEQYLSPDGKVCVLSTHVQRVGAAAHVMCTPGRPPKLCSSCCPSMECRVWWSAGWVGGCGLVCQMFCPLTTPTFLHVILAAGYGSHASTSVALAMDRPPDLQRPELWRRCHVWSSTGLSQASDGKGCCAKDYSTC